MDSGNGGKNTFLTTGTAVLATAGVGFICVVLRARLWTRLRRILWGRRPMEHKQIKVVETTEECQQVVNALNIALAQYKVLGFDCEWVTVGGTRRPVALLQLSSHDGLCALFRLCSMQQIPKCLRELLECDAVLKVGVGSQDDAQKLSHDYGVGVASTFDLRFLAAITGHKAEGLARLSKNLLKVQLDKNWRLACSDWEAKVLSEKQLNYAADDALVAVEIFKKLAQELEPTNFWSFKRSDFGAVLNHLLPFVDVRFREGFLTNVQPQKSDGKAYSYSAVSNKKLTPWQARKQQQLRGIATRSKVQYDNCLLQAPDGELLCTIDRRKAKWYMQQNLGTEVQSDPFTVRLNFEPAGRAVGEVGRYYQTPKENQCVVCGRRDCYIRKNVVPREYRKHFPVVMKSHTSHDVLLLCPSCHQASNISDLKVRTQLAEQCDAPFTHEDGGAKQIEVPELRQLRSAARALLLNGNKIPAARRDELQQVVLAHFGSETECTPELLEEAAEMDTTVNNEQYRQHGERVVQAYQRDYGGLIELEKRWREHFLHTMKPKYLPVLWNVNFNANRLEIRASEGRLNKEDLLVAGLDETLLNTADEITSVPQPNASDIEP